MLWVPERTAPWETHGRKKAFKSSDTEVRDCGGQEAHRFGGRANRDICFEGWGRGGMLYAPFGGCRKLQKMAQSNPFPRPKFFLIT